MSNKHHVHSDTELWKSILVNGELLRYNADRKISGGIDLNPDPDFPFLLEAARGLNCAIQELERRSVGLKPKELTP